jgi:Fe2+ transport system protein B
MREMRVKDGVEVSYRRELIGRRDREREREKERKETRDRREREREKREKQKKRVTTRSLTTTSNTLFQLSDDVDSLVKHRQLGLRLVNLEMHLTHAA